MGYMVDTRGKKPDLVRNERGFFERYNPTVPGKWSRSKFLDEFSAGGGDYVWYDDISPEEAKKFMKEIDDYWAKKGNE